MQSGLGQPAAVAGQVGYDRRYGRIGVLLLGLAVSACVNTGQIANLTETRRPTTVAFESIDGPPPAVLHKFVNSLKEEAGARQITVVAPGEANYRLRGYLAAHGEDGATSISWALDVYDADQRRAFRLSGEEKTAGRMWAAADDQVLHRIARAGMERFALFSATARPPSGSLAAASPPPQRTSSATSSALGWLDDWTPEASGIFRILRREPARSPEIAADAGPQLPPDEVPLPRGRPAPSGVTPGAAAFAFAPEGE
jgi:hypothetical protein